MLNFFRWGRRVEWEMQRRRIARPMTRRSMSGLEDQGVWAGWHSAKSERSGLTGTSRYEIKSLNRVRPNSKRQQLEQLAMQKGLVASVRLVLHG